MITWVQKLVRVLSTFQRSETFDRCAQSPVFKYDANDTNDHKQYNEYNHFGFLFFPRRNASSATSIRSCTSSDAS